MLSGLLARPSRVVRAVTVEKRSGLVERVGSRSCPPPGGGYRGIGPRALRRLEDMATARPESLDALDGNPGQHEIDDVLEEVVIQGLPRQQEPQV